MILAPLIFALLAATGASAYPLDGAAATGIPRLQAYEEVLKGSVRGPRVVAGAQYPGARIELALASRPDFEIPAPDRELSRRLASLAGGDASVYGIALLDLTDPQHPVYAEHNPGLKLNPGSVGKLIVLLGWFQTLADVYPDDLDARRRVLRETMMTADSWMGQDEHTVPLWSPGDRSVTNRPIRHGDTWNVYTYLDHMISKSSNAAAALLQRELLLLDHFGREYPADAAREQEYLSKTPRPDLVKSLFHVTQDPIPRSGLDLATLRQGGFFSRTGKARVPGTSSYATARSLMEYLVQMEKGKLVDPFSSLETKRILYSTDRRIRYASAPALADSAIFFKSGSFYDCGGGDCPKALKYKGTLKNYMNSVIVVETPDRAVPLRYAVTLLSNVLGRNSAVVHQTMGTRIHRLMEERHPAGAASLVRPEAPVKEDVKSAEGEEPGDTGNSGAYDPPER
ncbi:MAG: hypothetical protein IT386_13870 [Deltaproteobacteria bacterium]|nr:hypothetical protein [Deltaproteobacteria bacterium]